VYSWRVPLTIGNADLTIAFSQDLGYLGGGKSESVVLPWRWYYHVPNVALFWGLLVLTLVGTKENRHWSAWAVLLSLTPILMTAVMVADALSPVSRTGLDFGLYFLLSIALISLRPMQRLFSERLPTLACVSAVLILSTFALACWLNRRGVGHSADDIVLFVSCVIGFSVLFLPITIVVCFRRRSPSPERSTVWPFLWTVLTAAAVALVVVIW
jgi:hypothetical protein